MSASALSAATQDRKARLAQLKSLKRKQPDSYQEADESALPPRSPKSPRRSASPSAQPKSTDQYLSGRNYDPLTRGPKLGFEGAPNANAETLEKKAAELAEQTRQQALEEAAEDAPLDLFKLQPKKPNWDLKRDLERKMEVLNVRTENAIARLVRERIASQKKPSGGAGGEGEDVGMEGTTLAEATNVREREDEEDTRRENEAIEEMLDGS
ncbi:hypothetical protein H2203_008396 [Taxawa tesnikishii (nom. ined.)]|nr:hypothetical protein H2203_008396 [Dothideales sp. JES 119]